MMIYYKMTNKNAKMPVYKTEGSSGADLYSCENCIIKPGEIKAIDTGIALEMHQDYEGQIRSRSGLSLKGIAVANGVGTIDNDFRGSIRVILSNYSNKPFKIEIGSRIAQIVFQKIERAFLVESKNLSKTKRGENGFGSTGNKDPIFMEKEK